MLRRWLGRISGYEEKLRLADAVTAKESRRVLFLEALVRKKERTLDHWEEKRKGAEERLHEANESLKEVTAEAQAGWQRVAVLEDEVKSLTAEHERETIELGERIIALQQELAEARAEFNDLANVYAANRDRLREIYKMASIQAMPLARS